MSEVLPFPTATDGVAEQLAVAVLTVPGVVRLVPTWHRALRGVTGTAADAGRAITVRVEGDVVDVSADVATTAVRPAAVIAQDIVIAIRAALAGCSLTTGLLTINVLDIQPAPVTPELELLTDGDAAS